MRQAGPWFIVSLMALAALCGCGGGTQKVLYAVAPGSDNVSIFTVSGSGALTTTSEPVSTGQGPVAIAIDPQLRFAYVVDSAGGIGPGGVSQYTLSAGSGALAVATLPASNGTTPPSTPAPTGVNPVAIAIDSTGSLVFVANQGSASLSAFTIDSTGGALTEVKQLQPPCTPSQPAPCPLPTMPTGAAPTALATTGKMLFVAMINAGAGSISTYTFNSGAVSSTLVTCPAGPGCLQNPPAFTIAAGTNPSAMAMDSRGKFLFVTDPVANTVAAFSIASSGQLTAVGSPVAAGTTPVSVRVHPGGKFLYTANQGSNNLSAFSIDSSGTLTPLSGSPVAVAPGTSPSYVATDTAGSFLFVANSGTSNISVFSIDSSGALKAVTGSPFPSVVINPVALASIN